MNDGGPAFPATKEAVYGWAALHLEVARVKDCPACWWWEKTWCANDQHLCLKLRLFPHDHGAWVIVGSADAAYAGNDDAWKEANMGSVYSIETVQVLYDWFETQAKESCLKCEHDCVEWEKQYQKQIKAREVKE